MKFLPNSNIVVFKDAHLIKWKFFHYISSRSIESSLPNKFVLHSHFHEYSWFYFEFLTFSDGWLIIITLCFPRFWHNSACNDGDYEKVIGLRFLKFPWLPSRAYSSLKSRETVFCMSRGDNSWHRIPINVLSDLNKINQICYVHHVHKLNFLCCAVKIASRKNWKITFNTVKRSWIARKYSARKTCLFVWF